jgi:hypothetical protein
MPPMRLIWVCMGGGTTPANTSASMAAARGGARRRAASLCLLHCLGRTALRPCVIEWSALSQLVMALKDQRIRG